eukprot:gnl/MRDRNA2_/MRDRNA2_87848_c0_seq1.p1 gnl/MRDRNA2_/MRDRNA2_87848_c0~~gnl/MRDRNA2_/MRDRNA2_87848_c0_seq1.p1  ORF type:complete len:722 (-),score=258.13 gnl/MRDRNA2_/MRDRNA2_87848_c0_seq1:35-2116(-)
MQYFALCLLSVVGASGLNLAVNPVTRVVQLLEGLSKKLTMEAKAEQDLFDKYGCWAKTIIDTKTASNAAAKDRIESLEAYIADIEAGNIEFTTERIDLEKQIAALEAEIEEAGNLRDKEHEDFLAAKDEMEKAIAALEEAVEVLGEAQTGNLLSLKFDIRRVMQVGANILSKGDLAFMEHLLDGDVPKPDWKKLNRKATFKMEYSSRSKKIHAMLQDMLKTFQDNLAEAEKKETETQESYDALMESKNAELDSLQTALTDASQEGAARGLNKNEAQAEVDDLKAQVEADKGFIADTEKSLEEKTKEFEERKKLRMAEIGAISEAIGILRSDEARDTFKKSYSSQGYLFLQMRHKGEQAMVVRRQALIHQAFVALRSAGEQAQDAQLSVLALKVLTASSSKGTADEIKEVIEAIDKMIARLEKDEEDDLKTKEECEKDRMADTADARSDALGIDDATEEIARQESKVKEQKEQIKIAEEAIKGLKEELKEATRTREDEKAAYEADKVDDENAVKLIEKAMNVLKEFYSENFSILQVAKQPPKVVAGEAPPPPPPTFEGGYGGAKGETNGIQSILGLIKEDIEADIEKNTKAEEESQKAYDQLKEDTETAITDEEKTIEDAKSVIADAEEEMVNQKKIKDEKHETLTATIEQIKSAEPGCNFMAVNFQIRTTNRHLEIDGLKKAKAILEGGDFSL